MIAYHTITPEALDTALRKGLKCSSRGEKGDDSAIIAADKFLDAHRPDHIIESEISRQNNLYAYVADGNRVVNIANGQSITLAAFLKKQDQTVLQLTLEPQRCYISDIDLFDAVKSAIEQGHPKDTNKDLAVRYWKGIRPIEQFTAGDIRRPEIMITYDIPPTDIKVLS